MAIQSKPRCTRVERLEARRLFAATLTTLATFTGKNGEHPQADLTADAAGNLYGVAAFGGAEGFGTVFEVAAGKHAVTTLATFDDSNGRYPRTQLLADADGNLFGTAGQGGLYGSGTVFEISATDHTLTTLADFDGTHGYIPGGNLVFDGSGNLYGTTYKGGANDMGTVYELAAGTHALTTLATFDGDNGSEPNGGLVADAAGNLYGVTYKGGANDDGMVFKVAAGNHALTTLVTFNETNGLMPLSNLLSDAAGNLYGTTDTYAGSYGSVFEVSAASRTLTTLATFDITRGSYPQADLIADSVGNLYGTTSQGGASDHGTVFKVAAGTHTLTTMVAFKGTNGANPEAGLIADASGTLYGTTNQGGSANFGTVFKLTNAAFGQTPPTPSPAPAPTPIKTVGGLDSAFGTNGLASHNVGFTSTTGNAADGTQSVLIGPIGTAGAQAFGVTRYNGDGSLDTSFGTHGVATARFTGTDAVPTTVSVFADGHILVAGTATTSGGSEFAVAAFNADGSVDSAFGTGGKVLVGFGAASSNDVLHAMAVGSSGTVYLGGRSNAAAAGNADFAVAALNADGSLDTRFGSNGEVLLDIASGDDIVNSLAVQTNGDAVAAGSATAGDATEVALARFLPTGALDRHFGGTGFITSQVGTVYDAAESVALQPKGQIVVGGLTASGSGSSATSDYLLQRYTTTGKPDRSFGTAGSVTTSLGQPAAVTQVIVQPDGSIIASGRTSSALGGTLNVAIARYTTQGLLDTAFNGTGTVVIDLGSGATRSTSLASAAASLGTLFDAFLNSQQGTVAVTPGGEILTAGSSGDNTVEAELVAAGVDLVTKVLSALPASANGKAKAALTVTEAGTERAIGSITITVSYATESTGDGATTVTTAVYTLKLKPAKTKAYHLSFAIPDALAAGSYYLTATVVNGTGLPDDLNANNNYAVSASAVTV